MSKITIILTSYNHESFLKQSIDSILNQTYTDFELYIIDDCSSDRSWDIILEYSKKDRRIIAIRHEENLGGPRFIDFYNDFTGEYIAIAHSDDTWDKEKLEKQVRVLDTNPSVGACFTWVNIIDDDGLPLSLKEHPYLKIFEQKNRNRFEWLNHFFYHGNCLCHPSVLIRKQAYAKYDIFPKGLHGNPDFYQWIRLCKHTEIMILQEQLTSFRVHANETNSSGVNPNSIKRIYTEEFFVLEEYKELLKTHEITRVFPQAIEYEIDGELFEEFALAKIFLDGSRSAHRLIGLTMLYGLFQNKQAEQTMREKYQYTRDSFNKDKMKYDIFNILTKDSFINVSIFATGSDTISLVNSLQIFIDPNEHFRFEVVIEGEMPFDSLRVDLDEGNYRRFKITDVRFNQEKVECVPVNGIKHDEWDEFYTLDPQYMLSISSSGMLVMEGKTQKISNEAVESHFREVYIELNKAKDELNSTRIQLNMMNSSKYWKIYKKVKKCIRGK